QIYPISTVTREGVRELLFAVADLLDTIPKESTPIEEKEERVVYKYEPEQEGFQITRDPDGAFVLSGERIEKLFRMTDFNRDESVRRFSRQLRGMGIDEALRKHGAEDGDTVRLLDYEFEFIE
ncbi:Obg family GTPase CgtA, partial [Virgibacillus senegalensis]